MNQESVWLPAAKLLRPQGRKGEILAEPQVDVALFTPGRRLWLEAETANPEGTPRHEVQEAWQPTGRNAGRVVLKLSGVDSISEAEALGSQMLFLPLAELPQLDEDTFLVRDLVDCVLFDRDREVGRVVDVQFPVGADGRTRLTEAPDLLAVLPTESTENSPERDPVLVPFVRAWLVAVDLPGKRIEMQLPPGLFDTLEES